MFYAKYKYEEKDRQYILGKKQFMARFSTRRRFYRLIGRLSIIEILVLYLPSIVINISNLFYVKFGT